MPPRSSDIMTHEEGAAARQLLCPFESNPYRHEGVVLDGYLSSAIWWDTGWIVEDMHINRKGQ